MIENLKTLTIFLRIDRIIYLGVKCLTPCVKMIITMIEELQLEDKSGFGFYAHIKIPNHC